MEKIKIKKMKARLILSILITSISISVNSQIADDSKSLKDIDGNTYPIYLYRGYNYMTENLEVKKFRNGDELVESHNSKEWKKNCKKKTPTYMVNKNHPDLGLIYNGYAVYDSRGLLPEGWTIPGDSIFYEEFWQNKYEGNEKNRSAFILSLLGKIYISSNAYNSDCRESKSFFIEPDGVIRESSCQGGRWWMEEGPGWEHIDNSFSTSCCTGRDGAHHGDYFKTDWQSWGFYVRGIKKQ
jgi:hypothetical protein